MTGGDCWREKRSSDLAQPLAHPPVPDPFLLEPQILSNSVGAQSVEQRLLLQLQSRKLMAYLHRLLTLMLRMRVQRLAVHEEGRRVGEVAAYLVRDRESLHVDVAPVVNRAAPEPLCPSKCSPAIASSEDHEGVGSLRKRQEVGLSIGFSKHRFRRGWVYCPICKWSIAR